MQTAEKKRYSDKGTRFGRPLRNDRGAAPTVVHTGGTSKAQTNAQKRKAHPYIPMIPKELTNLEGACERCPNFELANGTCACACRW